jgi:hypothetical protein
MNMHVSDELRKKWPQYEFIGKPVKLGNKYYIWAKFKDSDIYKNKHLYCYEDDFFWHEPDFQFLKTK